MKNKTKVKIQNRLIEINGNNLLEKDTKLFHSCIGKYFNIKMQEFVGKRTSKKPLDIDACFESMLMLFKEGALKANIEDINNFSVFFSKNKDNIVIFQLRNGEQLIKKKA